MSGTKIKQPAPVLVSDVEEIKQPAPVLVSDVEEIKQPAPVLVSDVEEIKQPAPVLVSDVEEIKQPAPVLVSDVEEIKQPAPVLVSDVEEINRYNLQELYRWLDNVNSGDRYLAWYGQCRALGLTHHQAIADTVTKYGLHHTEWFQKRGLDVSTLELEPAHRCDYYEDNPGDVNCQEKVRFRINESEDVGGPWLACATHAAHLGSTGVRVESWN